MGIIMINWIENLLADNGIRQGTASVVAVAAAAFFVALLSVLAYFLAKIILLRIIRALAKKSRTKWDDALVSRHVFERLTLIIPAVVIHSFASSFPAAEDWIRRIAFSIIILGITLAIDKFLDAVNDIYRTYEVSNSRPIKGYLQLIKIFIYIISAVLIISVILDRSPLLLLGGIGAATAVLLLIFQNSILGFVASIQLTENDMIRIGDWIEMPSRNADGDVIDVSLHTVKVQNWDKTVTTIPTHSLVSESFKNWRAMTETGGRRIKRSIYIDMTSIRFCDGEMLSRYRKIRYIKEYIDKKTEEIEDYNKSLGIDRDSSIVDGRHMTNIGTFRAYVTAYIANHPRVHKGLIGMVRQLEPTDRGLPLEIYAFTSTTKWVEYEGIQADIFDHIFAVIPEFDLRIYQGPTGHDLLALGESMREKTEK